MRGITGLARLSVFMACALTVSGCVRGYRNDPASIAQGINYQRNEFRKTATYRGPNCATTVNDEVRLIAIKDEKLNALTYGIYVSDYYNYAWRYYDSAYDSEGNKLPLMVLKRDVVGCRSGCSFEEQLALDVGKDYLDKHRATGIRFQISGGGAQEVFEVPGLYVDTFLKSVP